MNVDPFDSLGLPPSFALSRAELEKQHRELSRALHPDRFAGAPAGERRQALTRAIEVNEAFRSLRDPVTRGEALLARLGVPKAEREAPAAPAFLLTMMELREGLAAAAKASKLDRVKQLSASVEASQQALVERLTGAFASLLERGAAEQTVLSVKQQLGELRYYRRFLEEAATLLDEMD